MCKPLRSKRIAAGDTEVPRCRSIAITSKWRSAFGCVRAKCRSPCDHEERRIQLSLKTPFPVGSEEKRGLGTCIFGQNGRG